MDIQKLSVRELGQKSKSFVAKKLISNGFSVEMPKGVKNVIKAKSGDGKRSLQIRVRSRRTGNWQISKTEGRSPQEEVDKNEFWVLVDFTDFPDDPDFYIMPGTYLRRNIYEEHQKYLLLHGGVRPVTPKSTHHLVRDEFIDPWKDRWDILGLK